MGDDENKKVYDMEIAKAKDLIFEAKRDFNKKGLDLRIRYYEGNWNRQLDMHEIFLKYAEEYSRITNMNLDMFIRTHEKNMCYDYNGCLDDFKYENQPLKEILIKDIIEGLKDEFPENFKEQLDLKLFYTYFFNLKQKLSAPVKLQAFKTDYFKYVDEHNLIGANAPEFKTFFEFDCGAI